MYNIYGKYVEPLDTERIKNADSEEETTREDICEYVAGTKRN